MFPGRHPPVLWCTMILVFGNQARTEIFIMVWLLTLLIWFSINVKHFSCTLVIYLNTSNRTWNLSNEEGNFHRSYRFSSYIIINISKNQCFYCVTVINNFSNSRCPLSQKRSLRANPLAAPGTTKSRRSLTPSSLCKPSLRHPTNSSRWMKYTLT